MMIREPAVAGSFYPGREKSLREMIEGFVEKGERRKVVAVVSPHAGYTYSGSVAGALFSAVEIPDTALILAPNHYGFGAELSLWPRGKWRTPLGEVPISDNLNRCILGHATAAEEDTSAHTREHSAEVQLPFLQYFNPNVQISAIVLGGETPEKLIDFGKGIANAVTAYGKDVLIVASSDMTHYEPHETAKSKDKKAIDEILALNPQGLYATVRKNRISMCGWAPTVAMLAAANQLGATKAELIKYQTSGDVTGDYAQVVGYAGIAIW